MRDIATEYEALLAIPFENAHHAMGVLGKWRKTLSPSELIELRRYLANRIAGRVATKVEVLHDNH